MKHHQKSGQAPAVPPPDESLPRATEPRSAISSLVQKALVTFNERQRHRKVLINLLILAQALLVVAAAPSYVGAKAGVAPLAVVLASLVICLLAALLNQVGRDTTRATYVLVIGSGLAVLAQVFLAAVTGTAAQAAQASLLLLTVLLEAGLFFAPVATMLLAGGSIALTIVAFVIAVALAPGGGGSETYGLIVGTLGLQTVTGLVAWLLAQFVHDSVLESQRSQDAQFAQARLDAVLAQQAERQRREQDLADGIHQATLRALGSDARARAVTQEGAWGAIARDVNQLLERLRESGESLIEHASAAGTFVAAQSAGAGAAGAIPPALPQADHLAKRLQRVQELASELAGALAHSREGLDATAAATEETQAATGASVALAHELLASAQQAVELVGRAQRALAPAAPRADDVPDASNEGANGQGEPLSFLGLGADVGVAAPGLTGQFQVLPDGELVEVGSADAPDAPTGVSAADETPADETPIAPPSDLPELESALGALREAIAIQERHASTLTQDLGLISRHVRGIDGRVAWARQAVDAMRRNAERLHLTAGGSALPPAGAEGEPNSLGPTTSRPLADAQRSFPSGPPVGPTSPSPPPGEGEASEASAAEDPELDQPE